MNKKQDVTMIKKLLFTITLGASFATNAIQITPPNNVLTEESRYLSAKASTESRQPIVVEIKKVVGHQENGIEILEPTEDATVFPKQFMLNPDNPQSLTIKYNGPYEEDKERHYRIIAKTINLNDGTFKTGIKIQRSFHANLFVAPKNPNYKIKVNDIKISGSTLSYTVQNVGNFNTLLKHGEIELTNKSTGESMKFSSRKGPANDLEGRRYYPNKAIEVKSDLSELENFDNTAEYKVTISGIESRCIDKRGRCERFRYSN